MPNKAIILKNSLFLYFRMLLIMGVSLYTVRVVLNTLGIVDYGIYNVVGGIVAMFSFLSNSMASASQRFFSYELGQGNYEQLKKIFSITMSMYAGIAMVILILAETVGLWFLNTHMTIPSGRMEAANWIYQFSILSFMMTMFTIPYNALIIAHERMKVYAYVSIVEVLLKLLIAYMLVAFAFDKLKLYAVLLFCVTGIITLIYRSYCGRRFKESKFSYYWDPILFKTMITYSGWNLLGVSVGMVRNHGVNILINLFFNPAVNAAQAIATQINVTLMNFTSNFYTAVRPQIVKNYSSNNIDNLSQLVYSSARYSFYLMLILATPLIFEPDYILRLWLGGDSPSYAAVFIRIITINTLVEVINSPIITTIQASGQLKWYQLTTSVIQLLIIPLTFLCYKLNLEPYWAYYIMIGLSLISNIPRLIIFQKVSTISGWLYIKKVVSNIVVLLLSALIPMGALFYYCYDSKFRFAGVILYSLIVIPVITYFIGLESKERSFLKSILRSRLSGILR